MATWPFPTKCSYKIGTVVVVQLAEWSLLIPEVRSLTPVNDNIFLYLLLTVEKTKIDKKRPAMDQLKPFFTVNFEKKEIDKKKPGMAHLEKPLEI